MTVAVAALLLSCGSGADEAARAVDALPPIYPDYAGVTVPCNIRSEEHTSELQSQR